MFSTSLLPLFAAALAATPATVLAAPAADAASECGSLDVGTVLAPFPNNPSSFYNFPYYPRTAENATHPLNYERFMTASHRALSDDVSYLTYEELEEYDVGACARRCDGEKECAAFNIYFQRRPIQVPGTACPNPDATVVVRCALFKSSLDASQATNEGEIRGPGDADGESFEVRVAGSNGYNKLISPLSGRARASAANLTTVTETVTEPAIIVTVTVTTTPTTPKTPTTTPETPTTLETLTTPQPQPRWWSNRPVFVTHTSYDATVTVTSTPPPYTWRKRGSKGNGPITIHVSGLEGGTLTITQTPWEPVYTDDCATRC